MAELRSRISRINSVAKLISTSFCKGACEKPRVKRCSFLWDKRLNPQLTCNWACALRAVALAEVLGKASAQVLAADAAFVRFGTVKHHMHDSSISTVGVKEQGIISRAKLEALVGSRAQVLRLGPTILNVPGIKNAM